MLRIQLRRLMTLPRRWAAVCLGIILAACAPILGPAQAQGNGALTQTQIRELMARVAAQQHRNDDALTLYERREHRVARRREEDTAASEDKLFRVVPTGTGTLKLLLAERGKAVSSAYYREQLRHLEQVLVWALEPGESKQRGRVQKFERRNKERYETVEAAKNAFNCSWLGREERSGVALVKLQCEPNPAFEPATRAQEMFMHARAVLWIEPREAQLVRVEADTTRDVSIGGGMIGKIYKGGRFVMEQERVANGTYLPTLFRYDVKGRKFVFGFELHESISITQYQSIGPPAEALAAIRRELNGAQASLILQP